MFMISAKVKRDKPCKPDIVKYKYNVSYRQRNPNKRHGLKTKSLKPENGNKYGICADHSNVENYNLHGIFKNSAFKPFNNRFNNGIITEKHCVKQNGFV